ncbi:hypothetical protein BKA93DRAFT_585493 [Sparassis latifolia]
MTTFYAQNAGNRKQVILPELSPEITDRIIEFLWHDSKTLCGCDLISRRWLPSSRYHVFGMVRVSSREGLDSIVLASIEAPVPRTTA